LVHPDVGEVIRRVDALTDDWHADFIRLTMENYWQSGVLTDAQYLSDLHKIIDHIGTKKNVYVMLSMWHDPTLGENGWPTSAAAPIWQRLVAEFGDRPYVMFGLSNEPESNDDGALDGQVWQHMNHLVQVIRTAEHKQGVPQHLIAVQATRNWARSLEYYIGHPIAAGRGANIIYETHIYDTESDFKRLITIPAQTLPVVVGEFGPTQNMSLQDCEKLMQLAENLEVPYLAWTFHSSCAPNLIQDLSEHTCSRGEPLVPTAWGSMLLHHLEQGAGIRSR
jgi:endoglucanase